MKKSAILIILWFCLSNSVFASPHEVVIFNMSNKYDMSVTYRICRFSDSAHQNICSDNTTTLIKAKKLPSDENYIVKKYPTPSPETTNIQLQIISAIEKDEAGNVISSGMYFDDKKNLVSNCLGNLYTNDDASRYHMGDAELVLNDMRESPFITCDQRLFVAQ